MTTPPKPEIMARPGKVEQMIVDAEAAKMRAGGMNFRDIAAAQGCSFSTAHARAARAVREASREDVEAVRDLELARLDEMWRLVWEDLHQDHVKVDHGQIIYSKDENGDWIRDDDGRPVPVIDKGALHTAVTSALRIQERRAKYLGIDAPTRRVLAVVTDEQLEQELADLRKELADAGVNVDDYIDAEPIEDLDPTTTSASGSTTLESPG